MFFAGAVAIGLFLFRASPREVTLVYPLAGAPAEARRLEVEVRRGDEVMRRAEFPLPAVRPPTVSHAIRLPDGAYGLRAVFSGGPGEARVVLREFTVSEAGAIVLPL